MSSMTREQLRKFLMTELADVLDVDKTSDVVAADDVWAGGDDLVMPVNYLKIAGVDDLSESFDESDEPPDVNSDGVIDPHELYSHFDVDNNGVVTPDDYASHIEWHCKHPEILAPMGQIVADTASSAPCPHTYVEAADKLVTDPMRALKAIQPLMESLGTTCPGSTAKALADVIMTAQGHGVYDK